MPTARVYCSDLARQAGADPAGSMQQVDLWVLLEVPRPWSARVLEDNELPAPVQAWLGGIAAAVLDRTGLVARVLFVKQRTSLDAPGYTLTLAFSAEQGSRLYRYEAPRYADLAALDVADVAVRVQADMADPDRGAPLVPTGATLLGGPLVLVCTNGQRDLCCARFGRPLFEALATEFGEAVWQTSHIGGHRYAPNMVVLPQGSVYGFVSPERGAEVLQAEQRGELVLDLLRGRSCHAQAVQAAEVHLRRRLRCSAADGVRLQAVEQAADGVSATFVDADGRAHRQTVHVSTVQVRASCAAAGPKDSLVWVAP